MKCLICNGNRIKTVNTIISDFVMSRIDPDYETKHINKETKLCYCEDCTFAFYQYRFSQDEENSLYRNYRDSEYQRTREKYECWYTKKVNSSLGNEKDVELQRSRIRDILAANSFDAFESVLDYGGNRGATFYYELGTKEKYIYDISGVDTVPGITLARSFEELKNHRFDFIMCNMVFEHVAYPIEMLRKLYELGDYDTIYYIEVPSENPFVCGNKFSIAKNLHLLLDPNYSWIRLAKYYVQQRKQPFMPMKEHINFFTRKSIETMINKEGFSLLDVRETTDAISNVLSVLFCKNSRD